MKTIAHYGSTVGTRLLDFMDKAPGVIPAILTLVLVAGFMFFG